MRLIYATGNDLAPGLDRFERSGSFVYVQATMSDEPVPVVFPSYRDMPRFGTAEREGPLCDRFLVREAKRRIHIRRVKQRRGGVKYFVDGDGNPRAICFQPGGVFEPGVLIRGEISRLPDTPDAATRELYKLFVREVLRGFRRVRGYWVGAEALQLYHEGWRLTPGASYSSELDFRLP